MALTFLVAAHFAYRTWPLFAGWRQRARKGLIDRLLTMLARLRKALSGKRGGSDPGPHPLEGWRLIADLPPGEAVAAAYGRVLALAGWLGSPRREEQTPLEFLNALPSELQQVSERGPSPRMAVAQKVIALTFGLNIPHG